jgi:hypothetical protein
MFEREKGDQVHRKLSGFSILIISYENVLFIYGYFKVKRAAKF